MTSFLASCGNSGGATEGMNKNKVELTINNYHEYLRVNSTYFASYDNKFYRIEIVSTLNVVNYVYSNCYLTIKKGYSSEQEVLLGKNGWYLISPRENDNPTIEVHAVRGTLEYWF